MKQGWQLHRQIWILRLDLFKQITPDSYYKAIRLDPMNRQHSLWNNFEVIVDKHLDLLQEDMVLYKPQLNSRLITKFGEHLKVGGCNVLGDTKSQHVSKKHLSREGYVGSLPSQQGYQGCCSLLRNLECMGLMQFHMGCDRNETLLKCGFAWGRWVSRGRGPCQYKETLNNKGRSRLKKFLFPKSFLLSRRWVCLLQHKTHPKVNTHNYL